MVYNSLSKKMYSFKNHQTLLKTFFVIGLTSFGGYMALIAMIRRDMVERDNVITDEFLTEGITLSSFLPGPVAVNVVAYIGYKLAGVLGALLSIIAVLLPSFLLVTFCSVLYFNFGQAYSFDIILIGIVPAVIGIILSVGLSMAKKICNQWIHFLIAGGGFAVLFLFSGYWAIVITLLAGGMVGLISNTIEINSIESQKRKPSRLLVWLIVLFGLLFISVKYIFPEQILSKLFLEFSGVSITLFGGGYVMIPTLKTILVDQLVWLNYEEFVFGISIGQVTPGPILISAAFFGYKMGGITGAIISSIGGASTGWMSRVCFAPRRTCGSFPWSIATRSNAGRSAA